MGERRVEGAYIWVRFPVRPFPLYRPMVKGPSPVKRMILVRFQVQGFTPYRLMVRPPPVERKNLVRFQVGGFDDVPRVV